MQYNYFNRAILVSFTFIASIYSSFLAADEAETISWAKTHFVPVYITEGVYKGRGIVDKQYTLLQENMPQYQHESFTVNVARIIRMMTKGKPVCSSFLKNHEREKVMYFSNPTYPLPTHELHIIQANRKNIEKTLGTDFSNTLSLETLLRDYPNLRLGAIAKRSYGPRQDALIEKYKEQIYFRYDAADSSGLFKMLELGRIDYILEYPYALSFYLKSNEITTKVSSFKTKEAAQSLYAYMACTKNDWGKKIIAQINAITEKKRESERYRALVESWLSEDSKRYYRQDYERFLMLSTDD
jgi:uncharacterized protein (TIGR02285 family)